MNPVLQQKHSSPLARTGAFTGGAIAAIGGVLTIYENDLAWTLRHQIYDAVPFYRHPGTSNWLKWFPGSWRAWLYIHSKSLDHLPMLAACLLVGGTLVLTLSLLAMFVKTPE